MNAPLATLIVKVANPARDAFCSGDELLVSVNDLVLYARLQLAGRRASVALSFPRSLLDDLPCATVGTAVKIRRSGSPEWVYRLTCRARLVSPGHSLAAVSLLMAPPVDDPVGFSFPGRQQVQLWEWAEVRSQLRAGMKRAVDGSAGRRFGPYERPAVPAPWQVDQGVDDTPPEPKRVRPELPPAPTNRVLDLRALQSAFDVLQAQVAKLLSAHENAQSICPVCLCENETPTVFGCGHAYCADCAPRMRGRPCGKCRQPLSGPSLRVYL
jgi:hypothetical protein